MLTPIAAPAPTRPSVDRTSEEQPHRDHPHLP